MDDFEIRGADQLARVHRALKAANVVGRREMNQRIRAAVKPLTPKTRAAARAKLPQRGGLADQVAREPQRVQIRTSARNAGVRLIVGKRRGGARSADEGMIRHPVPGGGWVDQPVTPGWFSDTIRAEGTAPARHAIENALDDMARRIVREAGG